MNKVEPNRNVYIGHRYVPLLVGEWDKTIQYEGLSIVTYQGASYTSKKMTPVGIDIENEEFWVVTGNYDAQVEYYRQETERVSDDLAQAKIDLNQRMDDTVEYVDKNVEDLTIYVNDEVRETKEYVDGEMETLDQRIETSENNIDENREKLTRTFKIVNAYEMFNMVSDYDPETGIGTDNTPMIQSAIDYAEENDLSVSVPKGSYRVEGSIQFKRNTRLYSDNATFYYTGAETCLLVEGSSSSHIYPRIEGLTVRKKNADRVGVGMSIKHSKMGGHFHDCYFYGFEYGVIHSGDDPIDKEDQSDNNWAWLNHFTHCRFTGNTYGLLCNPNSNGVTIENCLFNGNDVYAVEVFDSFNVRISNNEFETNGYDDGTAVLINDGRSILVSGNYFENNGTNNETSSVIEVSSRKNLYSRQPQIVNNFISGKNPISNIKIKRCQGFTITGNYFSIKEQGIDIDLSELSDTVYAYVSNNHPSRLNGSITHPESNYSPTSFIKHGGFELSKVGITLSSGRPKIDMYDRATEKNMQLENWNGRFRIYNNDGDEVFKVDGGNGRTTLSVELGSTENRPDNAESGQLYFDTTLTKLIIKYGTNWIDQNGDQV